MVESSKLSFLFMGLCQMFLAFLTSLATYCSLFPHTHTYTHTLVRRRGNQGHAESVRLGRSVVCVPHHLTPCFYAFAMARFFVKNTTLPRILVLLIHDQPLWSGGARYQEERRRERISSCDMDTQGQSGSLRVTLLGSASRKRRSHTHIPHVHIHIVDPDGLLPTHAYGTAMAMLLGDSV